MRCVVVRSFTRSFVRSFVRDVDGRDTESSPYRSIDRSTRRTLRRRVVPSRRLHHIIIVTRHPSIHPHIDPETPVHDGWIKHTHTANDTYTTNDDVHSSIHRSRPADEPPPLSSSTKHLLSDDRYVVHHFSHDHTTQNPLDRTRGGRASTPSSSLIRARRVGGRVVTLRTSRTTARDVHDHHGACARASLVRLSIDLVVARRRGEDARASFIHSSRRGEAGTREREESFLSCTHE